MMRTMLYEAQAMMRSKKWSWLKAWANADRCVSEMAFPVCVQDPVNSPENLDDPLGIYFRSSLKAGHGDGFRIAGGGRLFPPAPNDLCCDRSGYFGSLYEHAEDPCRCLFVAYACGRAGRGADHATILQRVDSHRESRALM